MSTARRQFFFFLALLLAAAFYWYEWRPSKIRAQCAEHFLGGAYENCLHERGL